MGKGLERCDNMYDYHVHTKFSMDSQMDAEDAIQRGIQLGIKEIAFTDHAEIGVWRPEAGIVDDIFDVDGYFKVMDELKIKYKSKIDVKFGMEIGLQKSEKEKIKDLIEKYPFDFVIGSSHTVDRYDMYYKKLFENTTKEEAYEKYFKEVMGIVKEIDTYCVYGHLDLVRRYAYIFGEYDHISINHDEIEMMREILKNIIEKGRGIEINTSGYRYGINSTHPEMNILKIYKDLGGEIITVGSDAHKVEDIGYGINDVYEALRNVGFKYITIFKDMEPIFIKL